MNPNTKTDQREQQKNRSAFTVINNVCDHCQQPDAKKVLMFVLARYCDREGICYPGNRLLMRATGKSKRRVQQMLKELEADGELKVLSSGAGHKQKRVIQLHRYATLKVQSATAPLNVQPSVGKAGQNNHSEQPVPTLTEYTGHRALRAADLDSSFSHYVEFEKQELRLFQQILSDIDPQWLPVRKYTDRVREALELLPNLETARALFEAASILARTGEDEGNFTWNPTGDRYDCYLPVPIKRKGKSTGKRTLVSLLQCNRDNMPEIADPADMLDDIPI